MNHNSSSPNGGLYQAQLKVLFERTSTCVGQGVFFLLDVKESKNSSNYVVRWVRLKESSIPIVVIQLQAGTTEHPSAPK